MILQICAQQLDEYKFRVWNTVPDSTYIQAGIDMPDGVTSATLVFKRVNDTSDNQLEIDFTSKFQYLFTRSGIDVAFEDFGEDKFNGFAYFPDWMYEVRVNYVYDGKEYTAAITVGFVKIIRNIINQQMLRSKWKRELSCDCGCDPYNTTLRKWNFLNMLEVAARLCLINEYEMTLRALYKLTGTQHEFE